MTRHCLRRNGNTPTWYLKVVNLSWRKSQLFTRLALCSLSKITRTREFLMHRYSQCPRNGMNQECGRITHHHTADFVYSYPASTMSTQGLHVPESSIQRAAVYTCIGGMFGVC